MFYVGARFPCTAKRPGKRVLSFLLVYWHANLAQMIGLGNHDPSGRIGRFLIAFFEMFDNPHTRQSAWPDPHSLGLLA